MSGTFGIIELSTPLTALVIYALWAMALVVGIALWRIAMVAKEGADPTTFPAGQKHGPDQYWRLNRAHLNTLENLPIFAAIVLAGSLTGHVDGMFGTLAVVTLSARIIQSLLHISSNAPMVVNLRFASLLVQIVCQAWMASIIL